MTLKEITSGQIAALLLAGGKSSRMGKDKRFLIYKEEPLILRAFQSVQSIAQEVYVLISCPEDKKVLSSILGKDVHFMLDSFPGSGPLGALPGVLPKISAEYGLLLSVDYPLIKGEFLLQMKRFLEKQSPQPDVSVPLWKDTPQVTCAFYRRSVTKSLQKAFDSGERSLRRWIQSLGTGVVYIAEETWSQWESSMVFLNLNTPEDYEHLMRINRGSLINSI